MIEDHHYTSEGYMTLHKESDRQMFPKTLDGAQVLFYTHQNNYGVIRYTTGAIAHFVQYLAICKYENDTSYYLFACDADCEVVGDSLWGSVEECMDIARSVYCDCIS